MSVKIILAAEFSCMLILALAAATGVDWTQVILALIGLSIPYMLYRQHVSDKRADADARARILRDEELKKAAETVALTLAVEASKQEESRRHVAEAAVKVVEAALVVKTTLADTNAVTDGKLDGLAEVAGQQTESLKEIHVAVNSTLTAAIEGKAEALHVAYLALKRVYEETGMKEEDRVVMEAARVAAEKAAEMVAAKAQALAAGKVAEEPAASVGLSGKEIKLTIK